MKVTSETSRGMPREVSRVTFIMMPLVGPGIIFGVALLVLMSRMGCRCRSARWVWVV
jgi:ABC-type spermidine/putrescine transport system permease subunit II